MCDSLYASSPASRGPSFFAKNSDRHPDEPQALCLVPGRPASPRIAVGAKSFERPDRGYSFLLSKPSWMGGGEMGLNERGVAIGNEAVFSRFKAAKDGSLGMDILRASLGHASTAAEARDFLCAFVEAEDQGGNGAYRGSLVYSNSFIVADPREAFVVETAGRRWAWKAIPERATISNAYSIESDYDAVDAATARELETSGEGIGWRAHVEDRFYLAFTKGDSRRACTMGSLTKGEEPSFEGMLAALRDHGRGSRPGRGMGSPCVHEAGFPVKSSTTASLIVEYPSSGEGCITAWYTGSSHPCLSVFVPILLREGRFIPLWDDYDLGEGSASSYERWEAAKELHRKLGGLRASLEPSLIEARDGFQLRLKTAAAEATQALETEDRAALDGARSRVAEALRGWEAHLGTLADSPSS